MKLRIINNLINLIFEKVKYIYLVTAAARENLYKHE